MGGRVSVGSTGRLIQQSERCSSRGHQIWSSTLGWIQKGALADVAIHDLDVSFGSRMRLSCLIGGNMSDPEIFTSEDSQVIEALKAELDKAEPSKRSRILEKFILAVLSSIPWVGGC